MLPSKIFEIDGKISQILVYPCQVRGIKKQSCKLKEIQDLEGAWISVNQKRCIDNYLNKNPIDNV